MVQGWRPVVVASELYEKTSEYFEENKEELKLRHGLRSLTAFINYCLREQLKKIGAI